MSLTSTATGAKPSSPLLELIVLDAAAARQAQSYGADRLEIVSAIEVGGLTPAEDTIRAIVEATSLPTMVMIRPHASSFVYDNATMVQIRRDIDMVRRTGAAGIVFGSLTAGGEIDTDQLARVVDWAHGLPITFHRAFDESCDLRRAYAALGRFRGPVQRVLSSGGAPDATRGAPMLASLLAEPNGVEVLVGAGVNRTSLPDLHAHLTAREYHVGGGARIGGRFDRPLDAEAIAAMRRILEASPTMQAIGQNPPQLK